MTGHFRHMRNFPVCSSNLTPTVRTRLTSNNDVVGNIRRSTRYFSVTSVRFVNSLYEELGVDNNATAAQIKAAYFRLSKKYHPDRNEDKEAVEKFNTISQAYEILSNWKTRRDYDAKTFGRKTADVMKNEGSSDFMGPGGRVMETDPQGIDISGRLATPHLRHEGHFYDKAETNYYNYETYYSRTYRDLIKDNTVSHYKLAAHKERRRAYIESEQYTGSGVIASAFGLFLLASILFEISEETKNKEDTERKRIIKGRVNAKEG